MPGGCPSTTEILSYCRDAGILSNVRSEGGARTLAASRPHDPHMDAVWGGSYHGQRTANMENAHHGVHGYMPEVVVGVRDGVAGRLSLSVVLDHQLHLILVAVSQIGVWGGRETDKQTARSRSMMQATAKHNAG